MRARLEKRHDSSWNIILDFGVNPLTGKRERKSISVKGRKPDAEKEMKRLIAEHEQGINVIEANKILLKDFLTQWLDVVKFQVTTKTYRKYVQVVNERFIPNLGAIPISKLSTIQLQNYFNSLLKDGNRCDGREGSLSPKTIKHYYSILHKAMEVAMKQQLITRNPVGYIDIPKVTKKQMNVYDDDQVLKLLNIIKRERIVKYAYYEAIYLAVSTGMRRNEILGLRWKDIDFDNKKINIEQSLSYNHGEGYTFKETKTEGSQRSIDIGETVIELFKKHRINYAEIRLMNTDIWEDNDLVFCKDNGTPWHPDAICGWFKRLQKKHNFPVLRFHDLRHTHATLLLKQGVHPKIVAERLGHASIRTTLDIYSHLLPSLQKEAINKFDELLKIQS